VCLNRFPISRLTQAFIDYICISFAALSGQALSLSLHAAEIPVLLLILVGRHRCVAVLVGRITRLARLCIGAFVCLSVCLSVCPVRAFNSSTEGRRRTKIDVNVLLGGSNQCAQNFNSGSKM